MRALYRETSITSSNNLDDVDQTGPNAYQSRRHDQDGEVCAHGLLLSSGSQYADADLAAL
jgi:hypothetical protein